MFVWKAPREPDGGIRLAPIIDPSALFFLQSLFTTSPGFFCFPLFRKKHFSWARLSVESRTRLSNKKKKIASVKCREPVTILAFTCRRRGEERYSTTISQKYISFITMPRAIHGKTIDGSKLACDCGLPFFSLKKTRFLP